MPSSGLKITSPCSYESFSAQSARRVTNTGGQHCGNWVAKKLYHCSRVSFWGLLTTRAPSLSALFQIMVL